MKSMLDESKIKITSSTRFGRFTVAEVEYMNDKENKTITGVGISKQGKEDKYKPEIGNAIAIARAKRAIYKKMCGKTINEVFSA